jgi:hypothetical protein
MSDGAQGELRLAIEEARAARQLPLKLVVGGGAGDLVRVELLKYGVTEAEVIVVEREPRMELVIEAPRHLQTITTIAAASAPGPRTPLSDTAEAKADDLLARYRHNDPDVAARLRSERLAKRAARMKERS